MSHRLFEILNVPDDGRKAHIGSLHEVDKDLAESIPALSLEEVPDYELDFMVLCAENSDDLKSKCDGLRYVKYDSMLWVILPKKAGKTTDTVFTEECKDLMEDHNVAIVDQIEVNRDWQAFQFRPYERVHKYDNVNEM